jgi:hypothetical protein
MAYLSLTGAGRKSVRLLLLCAGLWGPHARTAPEVPARGDPAAVGATLRLLTPGLLELELIQPKPAASEGRPWNFVTPSGAVTVPDAAQFKVTAGETPVEVLGVGFKRRALSAPLTGGELRVGTWLYLKLGREVAPGQEISVENPGHNLWPAETVFRARADDLRLSPAIHVNQVGYLPGQSKKALVGYFLGSMGELAIPAGEEFRLVDAAGQAVFTGRLTLRPDQGFTYSPAPYQMVYEADFTLCDKPGLYRLVVPALGASLPFRIDDGVALGMARAYALGVYHQRCGKDNALPFTRFVHAACHVVPASIPVPEADFPFTWRKLSTLAAEKRENPRPGGPPVTSEATQLYPFVRRGEIDVSGGHHDAGDYSKYTTNSASFIHYLAFAVDSLPGAAECDNLGLPESGDGIPDLLQEAKWEADFLVRMQDEDGGFYFLVYPRDRAYESNVLPDQGDPQVVWPKNTAVTAAAVAALAQISSSPRFRQTYPAIAADYLQRARKGWKFLSEAIARHGRPGAYQRLTHYGDQFQDDDELAWAAAELFLATGEEDYHRQFRERCNPSSADNRRWGWWRLTESWGHAIRSYAFGARSGRVAAGRLDLALLEKCEREVEAAGRDGLRWSEQSAYGTSFPAETKRMRGGGWYFSLDVAFDLAVASQLEYPPRNDPRPRFLAAYIANLDYEMGANPVNISYVTGVGQRRSREMVHHYAQSDRRMYPPSGLPLGNIQTGQPYLPAYKAELRDLSFPDDGAATAPYPYYDRWSDIFNVSTEFVIVNQARALSGLVWLAAKTQTGPHPWRAAVAKITGLPEKISLGEQVTARLAAPPGFDLAQADIVWEAGGGLTGRGETFAFTPGRDVGQWVEVEASWPDGRRVFATREFQADAARPVVTVQATAPVASVAEGTRGIFQFHRTGDPALPLTVHFELRGTATKWNDYHRPEGDMPVEIVFPAGKETVILPILPVGKNLGSSVRDVLLSIAPNAHYTAGKPREAKVTLVGRNAAAQK